MVGANIAFDNGNTDACLAHLQNITSNLRDLLKVFYTNLVEQRVSKSVWISYCQGFQAWGCGSYVDGEFVEYNGLSGAHTLFFRALDAFLGMDKYMSDADAGRYIPRLQREMCAVFREHSFFARLGGQDAKLSEEMKKIVNHLKVSRRQATVYVTRKRVRRLILDTAGVPISSQDEDRALHEAARPGEAEDDGEQISPGRRRRSAEAVGQHASVKVGSYDGSWKQASRGTVKCLNRKKKIPFVNFFSVIDFLCTATIRSLTILLNNSVL
jgi:hypothetical protein